MKRIIFIFLLALIIIGFSIGYVSFRHHNNTISNDAVPTIISEIKNNKKEVLLTAIGDCTIGFDDRFGYSTRYDAYLKNDDYSYYLKNVAPLFIKDDVTIANLEGPFTSYNEKEPRVFNFKASKEYREVLIKGDIEVVSFANNHVNDYGETGKMDTLNALEEVDIDYYTFNNHLIREINGIKIGYMGFFDDTETNYQALDEAFNYFADKDLDLLIASMHWGVEHTYQQNEAQVKMGHYLIDHGVDLVIGTGPHVIQGIEKYHDRYITYSLANFTFGGNQNPKDKDTFIFQQKFTFVNDKLVINDNINIIPTSVSGVTNTNNYQPTMLTGSEYNRVLNKIMKYSSGFTYEKRTQ